MANGKISRSASAAASAASAAAAPELNGVDPVLFGGETVERCTRLVSHPKTTLCGREPLGDHPSEDVRAGEKRLRLHRRGECLE
jgi:hypothetical protein